MAHFLIYTVPLTGHVTPGYVLARALVARGHRVWWYGGRRFAAAIRATGATFVPMPAAYDFDDRALDRAFPARRTLRGVAQLKYDLRAVFLAPVPALVADLEAVLRRFPADVLLADSGAVAAALVRERGGPPLAVYSISFLQLASADLAPPGLGLWPRAGILGWAQRRGLSTLLASLLRPESQLFDTIRAGLGLPPTGVPLFAYQPPVALYLQATVPEFEYPRRDLPATVRFIGPLLPPLPADWTPPPWWAAVTQATEPVVLVTQGTLATHTEALIRPALTGLAGEAVRLVVTADPADVGPLPANAQAAPFVPLRALLPHVALLITNGGYGGVQTALAHGVPLVGAGQSEDKREVTARIAWSGVGINLRTGRPTPAQVRAAACRVLTEPRYRHAAQRLQAAIARAGGVAEAAALLERLAGVSATRQTAGQPKPAPEGTAAQAYFAPPSRP